MRKPEVIRQELGSRSPLVRGQVEASRQLAELERQQTPVRPVIFSGPGRLSAEAVPLHPGAGSGTAVAQPPPTETSEM